MAQRPLLYGHKVLLFVEANRRCAHFAQSFPQAGKKKKIDKIYGREARIFIVKKTIVSCCFRNFNMDLIDMLQS
jgi:hypothetical protein